MTCLVTIISYLKMKLSKLGGDSDQMIANGGILKEIMCMYEKERDIDREFIDQ